MTALRDRIQALALAAFVMAAPAYAQPRTAAVNECVVPFFLSGIVTDHDCATPPPDRSWHLLTQTESGVVSLLKDLTKHECDFARARALGLPATDEERAAEQRRMEAEGRRQRELPICPANEKDWPEWRAKYPHASGCNIADGGSMSWGWTSVGGNSSRSLYSAECFQ